MIAKLKTKPSFACAIGKNEVREKVVSKALAAGWEATTLIDPSVIIADHVTVGAGTYVGAGSILSPYARIGNHVIINHGCSIGHDSILEDFCQVCPGGRISGAAVIRQGAFIGSNSVVAPRVRVGTYSLLGACSFAASNVPDRMTAIGNPARVLMPSPRSV
jgi:sugar O-acyltransferase (sialic acid O-acetyltransferase NeuD family)